MIRQGPVNQTVPVDSTVVLGCQTAGTPPPTVHWKRDGAVVSPVDSRMSIANTGSLEIRYAKVGDEVTQQLLISSLGECSELKPTHLFLSLCFLFLSWETQASTLAWLLALMERLPGQRTYRWRVGDNIYFIICSSPCRWKEV